MTYDVILFVDSNVSTWRMRSYGVYRLASELRTQGYSVKVVDWCCRIFDDIRLSVKLFGKLIGDNTLFVGFSSAHFSVKTVKEKNFDHYDNYHDDLGSSLYHYPCDDKRFEFLIQQMRKRNPNLKTVYGGGWTHDSVRLTESIDYIVYGLADATIVELANHLRHGAPLKFMPGHYPGQKRIKHDELGLGFDFPNSLTQYAPEDHIRPGEVLCLETSRGCMFKCKFCSYVLLGRKKTDPKYHKEISILAEELKSNWEMYKINRYCIIDDTFNESTEKLQDVYEAIKQSGVPDIKFFAYLRIDLLKKFPEQIPLLLNMGLQAAFFGIETLNDEALKIIGKPLKSSELKKLLQELRTQWGGKVIMHGALIFGLPTDTPEKINEWMQWIVDLDCPLDSIKIQTLSLTPIWPSVFGESMAKFGYEFIEGGNTAYPNWRTPTNTKEDFRNLERKYNKQMFYSRRSRISAYEILGLQNSGYTFEWMYRRARLDYDRLEFIDRLNQQYESYVTDLCSYEGIEL